MINSDFLIDEKVISVHSAKTDDALLVKVGDNEYRFLPLGEHLLRINYNGQSHIIAAIKHQDIIYIDIDSTLVEVREAEAFHNSSASTAHSFTKDKVFAPMPGKIVKVLVKKGDSVTEKQPLAVVEAMKMENLINSPASGRVKSVNFSAGDQVNTVTPIIELELEPIA